MVVKVYDLWFRNLVLFWFVALMVLRDDIFCCNFRKGTRYVTHPTYMVLFLEVVL